MHEYIPKTAMSPATVELGFIYAQTFYAELKTEAKIVSVLEIVNYINIVQMMRKI